MRTTEQGCWCNISQRESAKMEDGREDCSQAHASEDVRIGRDGQ